MTKRFLILWQAFIFLLFTQILTAQEVEKTDISYKEGSSLKKEKPFLKSMGKFISSFSYFDSSYVTPNYYEFSFMTIYYNNSERYSIRSSEPHKQRLDFSPRPHNKLGFYIGWQIIYLGFSFDIKDLFNHKKDQSQGTQFQLSLYTSKVGIDLMHITSGNNFRIHNIHGFRNDHLANESLDFNGLNVDTKSINIYYIFNNKKFSYPAAFNQSTVQRISTGSFLCGLRYSSENFKFDYSKLPLFIQENMNPDMKIENIKYRNISFNFGYSYNWVFAKNCLANISLCPGISYRTSQVKNIDNEDRKWLNKFNLDYLLRSGVVYNNGKYFVGASFLGRLFTYKQRSFYLNNGFGTLQVYAGFNFKLKKQYRHK